jgi:competence protein ComEC
MKYNKTRALLVAFLVLLIGGFGLCNGVAIAADTQSGLTVYFIDVGQADSALVLCDQKSMLIDGGNVADSDLVYTFLGEQETRLPHFPI